MSINWKGVFPAVTTKFTQDDKLDLDLFGVNIDAQVDAGVEGIVLGGTLGEASTLTVEEKEQLVRFAVDVMERFKNTPGGLVFPSEEAEKSRNHPISMALLHIIQKVRPSYICINKSNEKENTYH